MLSIFNWCSALHSLLTFTCSTDLPAFRQVRCPFCFMWDFAICSQCHNHLPRCLGLQCHWQIWGEAEEGQSREKEEAWTMPMEMQNNSCEAFRLAKHFDCITVKWNLNFLKMYLLLYLLWSIKFLSICRVAGLWELYVVIAVRVISSEKEALRPFYIKKEPTPLK